MKKQLPVIRSLCAALLICAMSNGFQAPSSSQLPMRYEKKRTHKKMKKKAHPRGNIKSVKGFEKYVNSPKRARVAAILYKNDGPALDAMVRMFERLDHDYRYHEAGVRFVAVNLDRGDLSNLVHDFALGAPLPAVLFFQDGIEGRERRIYGFLDESALRKIVEDIWGDDIDRILQEKEEERERRALQWLYYGYPYWYGYPYYGYPGYYYGYPYYYGYGPRYGVSFGVGF